MRAQRCILDECLAIRKLGGKMFLCQHACKFCDISKGTVDLFPSVLSEVMLQMTFLMKTAKKIC